MGGEGDAQGGGSVENFRDGLIPVLAVTAACFCWAAGRMPAGIPYRRRGSGEPGRLRGGISSRRSGGDYSACAGLTGWDTVRWPLLAAAGLHRAGTSGAALLFAVRGFLLAFSIASFVRLFGGAGCLLAPLGLWGERCAFGAGAVCAWGAGPPGRPGAGRTGLGDGKTPPPYGKLYFFRCGACAVALCVSLLLDCFVVPGLVSSLAGTFPEPIEILREGVGRMDYQSGYAHYLTEEKRASANTLSSYLRDVTQYLHWLEGEGVPPEQAAQKDVESYTRFCRPRVSRRPR